MSQAIILGSGSDIGGALSERLRADGWVVEEVHHDQALGPTISRGWDLVVCCYGLLEPIGSFWEIYSLVWENSFRANFLLPLRQIRQLYSRRNPGASVCFFSGAGTSGPAPSYSAYSASKVALVKMTELLDDESPDCKFFILGPGVVRTKIHQQTLWAGARAVSGGRVADFLASDEPGTSMDDIYAALMACVAAPKEAVGGRNLYVPLDDFTRLGELASDPSMFKLRRSRDAGLRR